MHRRKIVPLALMSALVLPAGVAVASPADDVLSSVREMLSTAGVPVPAAAAVGGGEEESETLDTSDAPSETTADPGDDPDALEDDGSPETSKTEIVEVEDELVEGDEEGPSEELESEEDGAHGRIVSTVARCAPRGPNVEADTGVANHGAFVSAAARGETAFVTDLGEFDLSGLEGAQGLCDAVAAANESEGEADDAAVEDDPDAGLTDEEDAELTSSSAANEARGRGGPPEWAPGAAVRDQRHEGRDVRGNAQNDGEASVAASPSDSRGKGRGKGR